MRLGGVFPLAVVSVALIHHQADAIEPEAQRWAVSGSLGFDGLNTNVGFGATIGLSVGYALTENFRVGGSLVRLSASTQNSSDRKVGAGFTEIGPFLEAGISSGSAVGGHIWAYLRMSANFFAYGGELAPAPSDAPDAPSANASVRADAGVVIAGTHFGVGPFVSAHATTSPKPVWWGLGLRLQLTF